MAAAAKPARWHELNGHPDFGALYPEGIPLPPLPPPAPPPRFYELEPQRDSRPPHRGPPLPHQRFVPRPPGAEPLPEPEEVEDEEEEEEGEEEEEEEEEAPHRRKARSRAAFRMAKWFELQPPAMPPARPRPPPGPPAFLPEDGRWVRMRPRLPDASVPHVLATLPEEREAAARAVQLDARGRPRAGQLAGGATPWPEGCESASAWVTADRHQKVVYLKPHEVAPPRGEYDEWHVPGLGDAPLRPPSPPPPPPRWTEMPPVDDGARAKAKADAAEVAAAEAAARRVPVPADEPSGKWYRIPNGEVLPRAENWRYC